MIGRLTGVVAEKELDTVIIDIAGVGYEVRMTSREVAPMIVHDTVTIAIHESIKEDAHDLYGFTTQTQKQLFRQLLGVKNVGPKVALAILDTGPDQAVRTAIASGNITFLQSAKGVGKRAAEQIIVELRDKVGVPAAPGAEAVIGRSGINPADEALQALMTLGYSEGDAQAALRAVDPALSTEERVRLALRA